MSQNQAVLKRLRRGPLTTVQAAKMHILRLGARIYDLSAEGHRIKSERVKGKPYHRYTLLD